MAAALGLGAALEGERAEAERWRERAFEAERRIVALREELARARESRPPPVAAAPMPAQRPVPAPADPPEPVAAPDEPPQLDPAWDALVAGTLRSEVQRRLGRALAPEQEERLLERLREVRRAGVRVDADTAQDEDGRRRRRLSRAIVLLEADRAFREELGMGVSDFLSGLDAGRVEQVGAPAASAAPAAP